MVLIDINDHEEKKLHGISYAILNQTRNSKIYLKIFIYSSKFRVR